MSKKSVQSLLDDIQLLGGERYATIEKVRSLVKELAPSVSEEVKYGAILFSPGVQFCGVFAYKAHVSVEFSYGANIRDIFGFLEGGGKYRRHIKLHSVEDIKTKQLVDYLRLGLEAAK